MNKKGSTAVIVAVILIVLVVIAFIVILIVVSQNPGNSEKIDEENTLKLYLESKDSKTQDQIESEYVLITEKGVFLSQGKLDKDSLLEIKGVPKEEKINIYCFGGNHYLSKYQKVFSQVEKDNNASKFTCLQDPLGNLKVTHTGSLNNTENIIIFNITSDSFKGLSAVMSWSSGIISVEFRDNKINCDTNWLNYSYYNDKSKEYLYLPEKNYVCENKVRECDSIQGISCILKENIPGRYGNEVDKAISTGRDLTKETYELILYVKTEEVKTNEDFLEIRFYDKDLIHIGNGKFQYLSEYQNINIGNDDFVYRVTSSLT